MRFDTRSYTLNHIPSFLAYFIRIKHITYKYSNRQKMGYLTICAHRCIVFIMLSFNTIVFSACVSCTSILLYSWWRHQMETSSALLVICAGNSPATVKSPLKGQWRGALMFSLIWTWINGWVNNREAGDLRRYRAHYDVSVMIVYKYVLYQFLLDFHRYKPLTRRSLPDFQCQWSCISTSKEITPKTCAHLQRYKYVLYQFLLDFHRYKPLTRRSLPDFQIIILWWSERCLRPCVMTHLDISSSIQKSLMNTCFNTFWATTDSKCLNVFETFYTLGINKYVC